MCECVCERETVIIFYDTCTSGSSVTLEKEVILCNNSDGISSIGDG